MSSCYEYELYKVIQTLQIVITKLLLMSHSYFSDMIEYLMNESSFELFQTIPSNPRESCNKVFFYSKYKFLSFN